MRCLIADQVRRTDYESGLPHGMSIRVSEWYVLDVTTRFGPVAVTTAVVAVAIAAMQFAPIQFAPGGPKEANTEGLVTASPQPQTPVFHSAAGFDMVVPTGWTASDRRENLNRRSMRLLVISNGPQPQANDRGLIKWSELPADHVVLELTDFSFPGLPGASNENDFPLNWGTAQPTLDPDSGMASALRFQYLLQSLTLTAYFGPAASAADRDALGALVASIRPEPIPISGVYRRWDVVGPLSTFPVGAVRHFDTPQSAVGGFFIVRGEHTIFAHLDHAYQFMGAMKTCPIRYDVVSRTFTCDATADRWSRTGAQLTGGALFGLAYNVAIVKDGLVLVGGGTIGGGGPPPAEADEFTDPIGTSAITSLPTRSEVLDRYSQITTTSPIERASAKLVTRNMALASDVIRGAYIRPDIDRVWVLAFTGDVRFPSGGEVHGRWAIFYVDAQTGGAITMACCGSGEWPPGFDALPDLASPGK